MAKTTEITASWDVTRKEVGRITLCGSTKFRAEYELWNKRLTLAGFLVYSVAGFGHSGDVFTPEEKERLDHIHIAKIDASHAIVVINSGGYIGESTRREIAFAEQFGKDVFYTSLGPGRTVYELRTGPDGPSSLRYRAFDWGASPPTGVAGKEEGCLTREEQRAQALRCSCRGTDEWCVCQNSPDHITRKERNQ